MVRVDMSKNKWEKIPIIKEKIPIFVLYQIKALWQILQNHTKQNQKHLLFQKVQLLHLINPYTAIQ